MRLSCLGLINTLEPFEREIHRNNESSTEDLINEGLGLFFVKSR